MTLREFSSVSIYTVEMVYLQCTRGRDWPWCSINSSYCPPDQQDWCRQPMARLRNGEGTVLVKASIPHPLTVPSVNMVSWCRSNWAHFRVPLCPHLHLFNRSCFRLRSELSGNSALSHHKFLSLLESQAARLWQQLVDTDCKP